MNIGRAIILGLQQEFGGTVPNQGSSTLHPSDMAPPTWKDTLQPATERGIPKGKYIIGMDVYNNFKDYTHLDIPKRMVESEWFPTFVLWTHNFIVVSPIRYWYQTWYFHVLLYIPPRWGIQQSMRYHYAFGKFHYRCLLMGVKLGSVMWNGGPAGLTLTYKIPLEWVMPEKETAGGLTAKENM